MADMYARRVDRTVSIVDFGTIARVTRCNGIVETVNALLQPLSKDFLIVCVCAGQ